MHTNFSSKAWIGKRVVCEINIGCGHCEWCLNDIPKHCKSRSALGIKEAHGCFAEYITVPVANLHEVPEKVSDENAVFAEPLAASIEFLRRMKIDLYEDILVMGDGKLGLLTAFALDEMGLRVDVLGKYLHKLVKVKERSGMTATSFSNRMLPRAGILERSAW